MILMAAAEHRLALAAFAEAEVLSPAAVDIALHAVEAASALGCLAEILPKLDARCGSDPVNPTVQIARGVALERLGRHDEAVDALEIAATLTPDAALPATLLGGILARSNRLLDAERVLRRAHELDPASARTANDLAVVLLRMHRHGEARRLLLTIPPDIPVLCNRATATASIGLQAEAVDEAEAAIRIDPAAVLPWRTLANSLPYMDNVDATRVLAASRSCGRRLPRTDLGPLGNDPDPDRPLTVGLLSGSLRSHPVGWLTVAGFELLDPDAFRLVCLGRDAGGTDPLAARFRALASAWIDTDALTDVALAREARARGLDILIDLGGYGDSGRMPACAHRLAPVQIKWVGMQNHSSGLSEMDWFVADRWEIPAERAHLYTERLLCLPDGYVCYSPPPYAPDVVPPPASRNGFITFGCFNNLAKITPRVVQTWAAILRDLPTARLILKTHQFSDAETCAWMRDAFAAHGIEAGRIDLRGASRHRAFMAEYNDVDIALDPFPYSSGLTTCEALWMGVPTVVHAGEIFAARHSMSHMCNAGLPDWVAHGTAAYRALAVSKAADIAGLECLRPGLRPRVKASPLTDAPRFGANLAAALRYAWREWCAGRTPISLPRLRRPDAAPSPALPHALPCPTHRSSVPAAA